MAVHIRLQRRGSPHKPFYHVVAADHRKPRDGQFIEKLGYYDPNTEPSTIVLKADRVQHWYGKGAQLTGAAEKLVKAQKMVLNRDVLPKEAQA
ncbi:MAG: 30S ribosomal protein S16 [Oligoflexales bacterium]|nr:30S ribosomal protein S16 [Oligoflexales bacterium]